MEMYNINEAFKALEDLPQIGSEERTIFRYNDPEDLKDLELFIKDSESDVVEDPVEMVVDIDAEDEEDIKDTYVGDIILGCRACNTLIYKIEDQLEVEEEKDDDGNDIYNKGEECPHCHSTIGFKLIGKVAPYNAEESEELKSEEEAGEDFEDEEVFQSTESEPVEDEEFKEEEVEVKESLNEDLDKAKELIDVVKDQLEVVDRKVSGAQSNVEKIKDELDESCDNCKESEKEELKEEDKSAAISIDDAQK